MTSRHYSNSQNSIILFDYSWFLAKNLSNFVSLPWNAIILKINNKIFCRRRSKRETNGTENGEYDDDDYYDSNEGSADAENDDSRIVNGYAAGKRPWLVLIIYGAANNKGMCGGSLINHRYVPQNTGKYLLNFVTSTLRCQINEWTSISNV